MKEVQMADWIEKITGDRAPLKDLREWEHRIVAAYSELLDGYQADIPAMIGEKIGHARRLRRMRRLYSNRRSRYNRVRGGSEMATAPVSKKGGMNGQGA